MKYAGILSLSGTVDRVEMVARELELSTAVPADSIRIR